MIITLCQVLTLVKAASRTLTALASDSSSCAWQQLHACLSLLGLATPPDVTQSAGVGAGIPWTQAVQQNMTIMLMCACMTSMQPAGDLTTARAGGAGPGSAPGSRWSSRRWW